MRPPRKFFVFLFGFTMGLSEAHVTMTHEGLTRVYSETSVV